MLRRAHPAVDAPRAGTPRRPAAASAAAADERAQGAAMSEAAPIWVSFEDAATLQALLAPALAGRAAAAALLLGNELARARLAPHAELPECMTLGARGRALLEPSGAVRDCVLVHPAAAHGGADLVSVLSETGAALLGLSAGQRFEWRSPDGAWRAVRLLAVSRPKLPLRAAAR